MFGHQRLQLNEFRYGLMVLLGQNLYDGDQSSQWCGFRLGLQFREDIWMFGSMTEGERRIYRLDGFGFRCSLFGWRTLILRVCGSDFGFWTYGLLFGSLDSPLCFPLSTSCTQLLHPISQFEHRIFTIQLTKGPSTNADTQPDKGLAQRSI